MSKLQVEGHRSIVRDTNSGAIISTDKRAYMIHVLVLHMYNVHTYVLQNVRTLEVLLKYVQLDNRSTNY